MTALIEKPSERELVESVLEMLSVLVGFIVGFRLGIRIFRINRIEIGCVRWMFDHRYVGRLLPAQSVKADIVEEGVRLDLVGAVAAEPILGAAAETEDEVGGRVREPSLSWNLEIMAPVDHLKREINNLTTY